MAETPFTPWSAQASPALDDDSQRAQDYLAANGGNELASRTPGEVRAWFTEHFGSFDFDDPPPVGAVEDRTVTLTHWRDGDDGNGGETVDLALRLYTPSAAPDGPLPAYIHCHAGAYVAGDLDLLDSFCRLMCEGAGCLVVSVDYRRAPEAKFPLPIEDCYAAVAWLADQAGDLNIDPARIAIGGDSSGGTLATVTCRLARDRDGPAISHQLLWYPGVGSLGETESERLFGDGYFPQNSLVKWSMSQYLNDLSEAPDTRVQPIRLEDMAGLPPAFIMTAGYDGRRDANLQYAERLRDAGVPTEFWCADSTIHGFLFMLGGLSAGRAAADFSAAHLRRVFHGTAA